MARVLEAVVVYNDTVTFHQLAAGQTLAIAAALNIIRPLGQANSVKFSTDGGSTWTDLPQGQETPVLSDAITVLNDSPYTMCVQQTLLTYVKTAAKNRGSEITVPYSAGAGGGAIPIPTSNDNNNLVLQSEPGGLIQINAGATVVGVGGGVELNGGYSSSSSAQGGGVFLNAALGGPSGEGGQIGLSAGPADDGSGALGATLNLNGGRFIGGLGGNLELFVGDDGADAANNGKLVFGTATGSVDLGVAPGSQTVTIGNVGPGASGLTVAAWLPASLDGVNGFIPFFASS